MRLFRKRIFRYFVAYYRRSLPRFNQVKTWLTNNEIGEIRHISWNFSKEPNHKDLSGEYNWRTDANIAPGGYLMIWQAMVWICLLIFWEILRGIVASVEISKNYIRAKDAVAACDS